MAKLFISHASHDKALVEAFVELLETGVGVPSDQIFCSSIKEQGINPGKKFAEVIRKRLDDASCVIAVVSEAYYASVFCMCELGATWALDKELKPIIVPAAARAEAKAVLAGLQQIKIDDEADLDALRDDLTRILQIKSSATPRWSRKRKGFLEALPELLRSTAFKGDVPRSRFEKLQREVAEYSAQCGTYEKQLEEKDTLIAELKRAKDAKEVRRIVGKHSSASEQFDALVKAAASALKKLPREACEALYYEVRREPYFPKSGDWDDVQEAAENGYLIIDADENTAMPKDDNRAVDKAQRALRELDEWIAGAPDELVDDYRQDFGEPPDVKLRSFWKRHHL